MNFEEFRKIPRFNRDVVITEKIDGTNAQILIRTEQQITDYRAQLARGEIQGEWVEPLVSLPEEYSADRVHVWAGSRNRWLAPGVGKDAKNDNFEFARWVKDNAAELVKLLGPGRHYGEWWGRKIGRAYGLQTRRFSLFNVSIYGKAPEVRDPRCYKMNGTEAVVSHKVVKDQKVCACRPAQEDLTATIGDVLIAPVPVIYRGPWFGTVYFRGDRNDNLDVQPRNGFAPALALQLLAEEGSLAVPFMDPEGIVVFHEASGQLFKATIKGDEKPKGLA